MSIRGKEVRPLIEPESHDRLSAIADFRGLQLNELAARLLEKAIDYEWHDFSVLMERAERIGKRWKAVEASGKPRSASDALRQKAEKEYE